HQVDKSIPATKQEDSRQSERLPASRVCDAERRSPALFRPTQKERLYACPFPVVSVLEIPSLDTICCQCHILEFIGRLLLYLGTIRLYDYASAIYRYILMIIPQTSGNTAAFLMHLFPVLADSPSNYCSSTSEIELSNSVLLSCKGIQWI
ncbi:hypothetical protein BDQ17DRAFT_1368479, partial [Cyathus striatus]